jgi:hypothetical protein
MLSAKELRYETLVSILAEYLDGDGGRAFIADLHKILSEDHAYFYRRAQAIESIIEQLYGQSF